MAKIPPGELQAERTVVKQPMMKIRMLVGGGGAERQLRNAECGVRNGKRGLFTRWKRMVPHSWSSCCGWFSTQPRSGRLRRSRIGKRSCGTIVHPAVAGLRSGTAAVLELI